MRTHHEKTTNRQNSTALHHVYKLADTDAQHAPRGGGDVAAVPGESESSKSHRPIRPNHQPPSAELESAYEKRTSGVQLPPPRPGLSPGKIQRSLWSRGPWLRRGGRRRWAAASLLARCRELLVLFVAKLRAFRVVHPAQVRFLSRAAPFVYPVPVSRPARCRLVQRGAVDRQYGRRRAGRRREQRVQP